MRTITKWMFLLCIFAGMAFTAFAQPQLPAILSSDMVLQQGQPVPVWGTAAANERIEVTLGDQKVATRADREGNWSVTLNPLTASKTPRTLTVKGRRESVVLNNILVGEVWLCSGQSNMQYAMRRGSGLFPPAKGEDLAALELEKPANNLIRVFTMGRGRNAVSAWQVADGESLANVSAAGYYFGKKVQEELDVPVGIITSAVGGTRIEPWTPVWGYEQSALFAPQLVAGGGQIDGAAPAQLYESLIAPLAPFAVKGFLWYQGESNCSQRDRQYAEKYETMVDSWRQAFQNPDAPFYSVLLGPHIYSDRLHRGTAVTAEELPVFWMQQIEALSIPNTEMIVISDLIDDLKDIHPSYKWTVGERLAETALANTYAKNAGLWSGPRLAETRIVVDSIQLRFDYAGDGLKTNDEKRLNWFEIAGADGVFHPAIAEFREKDKVIVYHPEIARPVQVRFGWHETAIPNLVNSDNLPAMPFRYE